MRSFGGLAIAAAVVLATPVAAGAPPATAGAQLDPQLQSRLASGAARIGVIAQFRTAPTRADLNDMLKMGFHRGMVRYTVVPAVYAQGPARAVRALLSHRRVTYVEADSVLRYALDRSTVVTRSRPLWNATYNLAGAAHDEGITGRGVGIAVVDTGVDGRHPDLLWKPLAEATGQPAKTIANVKIAAGRSNIAEDATGGELPVEIPVAAVNTADSDLTSGHGTHVAGIAAGNGRAGNGEFTGMAPGADLIGVGAGDVLVVHSALAAFQWLHDHHAELGIRVVNNSWGGAGTYKPNLALSKAIRWLVNDDGLVVVYAAGNSGGNGSTVQTNVWGNVPEVIQVANYYDRRGWLDDTSSRGLRTDEATWPDVAAPGTQIISTAAAGGPVTYYGSAQDAAISEVFDDDEPWVVPAPGVPPERRQVGQEEVIVGDYSSATGTSMAAPAVAGVVALVLEANPALTPADVRTLLRETANPVPGHTYESEGFAIGKGVVDAAEAVAVALKMREGLSLAEAIAAASLDLSSQPARINTGTGPVTDQTVPLLPQRPVVEGNPQIFHAGVIDPAVLTGTYAVAPGEPVSLVLRSLTSNDSAEAPLTPGNFSGAMRILRDGVPVYGPFATSVGSDSFGTRLEADWTVPSDAPTGDYVFETLVTVLSTGRTYSAAKLPFFIGAPG